MVIFSTSSLRTSQGRWRAKHTATPACSGVGPSTRSTRRPQLAQASVLSEKHTATSALLRRRSFSVIGVHLKLMPAVSAPHITQHHTLSAALPRSQFPSAILANFTRPKSSSARRLSLLRRRFPGDFGAVRLLARFVKGAVTSQAVVLRSEPELLLRHAQSSGGRVSFAFIVDDFTT